MSGRTLAEDIVDKQSNNVIAKTGDIISEEHLSLIDSEFTSMVDLF